MEKGFFKKNLKTINLIAFSLPPVMTSIISTVHIISWWGLSNPFIWAIFLALVIEIGALSSLAALTTLDSKNKATIMIIFGLITIMQIIGNVYFSYEFIANKLVSNPEFLTNWINLTEPIFSSFMVVSLSSMHRVLAYVSGMLLPLVSLSFLHILVNYVQKNKQLERSKQVVEVQPKVVYTPEPITVEDKPAKVLVKKPTKTKVKNKKIKVDKPVKVKIEKVEEPIFIVKEEETEIDPVITRDEKFTYVEPQNLDKKPVKRPII